MRLQRSTITSGASGWFMRMPIISAMNGSSGMARACAVAGKQHSLFFNTEDLGNGAKPRLRGFAAHCGWEIQAGLEVRVHQTSSGIAC